MIFRILFDGHQDIIWWSSVHYLIIMCCISLVCMLIIWRLLMSTWWWSVDNLIFMYWSSYVHLKQYLDRQLIICWRSYDDNLISADHLLIIWISCIDYCWSFIEYKMIIWWVIISWSSIDYMLIIWSKSSIYHLRIIFS